MYKFEENIDLINREIEKKRFKWYPDIYWVDFEDVSQIIRHHISVKWSQWDQSRPLKPWLTTIIHNQFVNCLRNFYGNKIKTTESAALTKAISLQDIPPESYFLSSDGDSMEMILFNLQERLRNFLDHDEYLIFDNVFLQKKTTLEVYRSVKLEFPSITQKQIKEIKNVVKDKVIDFIKNDYYEK